MPLVAAALGAQAVQRVDDEVGVPPVHARRAFVDHAGRLHQAVAEAAQSVLLLVAGQALVLKQMD